MQENSSINDPAAPTRQAWPAAMLGRYWPAHLGNPAGLLVRLIKSRNRAAFYTLWVFILTLLAVPFDLVMSWFEKKRIIQAKARSQPIIFICGPARSGTTITHQLMVGSLPVSYLSNLTAVFPRAPITAYRLFKRWRGSPNIGTESFYGKTATMSGPNDADHIWNRWVRPDATMYRTRLDESGGNAMSQFFRAFEELEGRPIVCKNNKLLAFATEVDQYVENAWYICLSRDPLYLAQSLIIAAETLQGDATAGYGLGETKSPSCDPQQDAISVAIDRVRYNQRLIEQQRDSIGADRFWVVHYEDLCENPQRLIERVSTEILKLDADSSAVNRSLPSLKNGNRTKLPGPEFEKLKQRLYEQAENK